MKNYEDIRRTVIAAKGITEFQRKVYLELLNVPRGATVTYGELARRVGCASAQAVGQALRRNPFAPNVPCHRVVGSNGNLTGYSGGVEKKRFLLALEADGVQRLSVP